MHAKSPQSCLTLCHPMERNTNKNHILTSMAIIKKSVKKQMLERAGERGSLPTLLYMQAC